MNKVLFSDLDKNVQLNRCTIPQLVSYTINPDDETGEQFSKGQNKFLRLPENVKNKLVSYQTSEKIKRIGQHYKLELLQMASVARMIRNYYFGEVKKESFPEILVSEAGIDQKSAEEISRYVVERIINTEIENKELEAKNVKMALTQAMEKYVSVQDQLISGSLIKISGKDNMVKGSIRNWIKDYYSVVGAGNKDIMKRSSYIYHSQNAKNLSATEKQKLGIVLKALDDNSLVTVDTGKEEIVFNISENTESEPSPKKDIPSKENTMITPGTKPVSYENKKADMAFGNKISRGASEKKESVLPKNNQVGGQATPKASHLGGPTENVMHNQAGRQAKINHVQGNRFDLKSDHFEDSDISKKSSSGILDHSNRKEMPGATSDSDDGNIKFSASQQLPVEKEQIENKQKKDFLRRIKPI